MQTEERPRCMNRVNLFDFNCDFNCLLCPIDLSLLAFPCLTILQSFCVPQANRNRASTSVYLFFFLFYPIVRPWRMFWREKWIQVFEIYLWTDLSIKHFLRRQIFFWDRYRNNCNNYKFLRLFAMIQESLSKEFKDQTSQCMLWWEWLIEIWLISAWLLGDKL